MAERSVEDLIQKGLKGQLTLEDVDWLKGNAHFDENAFEAAGSTAPSTSGATVLFRLKPTVDLRVPSNPFVEMSKEMERDY